MICYKDLPVVTETKLCLLQKFITSEAFESSFLGRKKVKCFFQHLYYLFITPPPNFILFSCEICLFCKFSF